MICDSGRGPRRTVLSDEQVRLAIQNTKLDHPSPSHFKLMARVEIFGE